MKYPPFKAWEYKPESLNLPTDESVDFDALVEEEVRELHWVMDDVLNMPREAFEEYGSAGLMMQVYENGGEKDDAAGFDEARQRFDMLCKSVPLASRRSVMALSLCYTTLQLMSQDYFSSKYHDRVHLLMTVAMMKGVLIGGLPGGDESENGLSSYARRKMLSDAGKRGAVVRMGPYQELKQWAVDRAPLIPGKNRSDRTIARKLAAQLPEHMADVSEDPMRLIYDTLRKLRETGLA